MEKQDYEKAFSYLDISELSQKDEVIYQKFVGGMEKFEEEGKNWDKHRYVCVSYISADVYEIEVRCILEDDSYIIVFLNVSDGKISPYMNTIPGDNRTAVLWEEFSNFVYTTTE